jgi:hypothetical protein
MEITRRDFLKGLFVAPFVAAGCKSREDRYSESDKQFAKVVNESAISHERDLEVMVGQKKVLVSLHGGAVDEHRLDYHVEDIYVEMRIGSETPAIFQVIDESKLQSSSIHRYRNSGLRGVRNDPEAVNAAKEFGKKVVDAVDKYQQAEIKKTAKKARDTLSSSLE